MVLGLGLVTLVLIPKEIGDLDFTPPKARL